MRESYSVEMDDRGYIVIPFAIRKAKGFGAHTQFFLVPDGDEMRLIPSEIRLYSNEEIAQALVDGAITPEGTIAAHASIRELGLDPADFKPNL